MRSRRSRVQVSPRRGIEDASGELARERPDRRGVQQGATAVTEHVALVVIASGARDFVRRRLCGAGCTGGPLGRLAFAPGQRRHNIALGELPERHVLAHHGQDALCAGVAPSRRRRGPTAGTDRVAPAKPRHRGFRCGRRPSTIAGPRANAVPIATPRRPEALSHYHAAYRRARLTDRDRQRHELSYAEVDEPSLPNRERGA